MKGKIGIYIDHSREIYTILSKEDTTRAIEKRCKGSKEIPEVLRFNNCDVEIFETDSSDLSQRIMSLENQFYENLTKYD